MSDLLRETLAAIESGATYSRLYELHPVEMIVYAAQFQRFYFEGGPSPFLQVQLNEEARQALQIAVELIRSGHSPRRSDCVGFYEQIQAAKRVCNYRQLAYLPQARTQSAQVCILHGPERFRKLEFATHQTSDETVLVFDKCDLNQDLIWKGYINQHRVVFTHCDQVLLDIDWLNRLCNLNNVKVWVNSEKTHSRLFTSQQVYLLYDSHEHESAFWKQYMERTKTDPKFSFVRASREFRRPWTQFDDDDDDDDDEQEQKRRPDYDFKATTRDIERGHSLQKLYLEHPVEMIVKRTFFLRRYHQKKPDKPADRPWHATKAAMAVIHSAVDSLRNGTSLPVHSVMKRTAVRYALDAARKEIECLRPLIQEDRSQPPRLVLYWQAAPPPTEDCFCLTPTPLHLRQSTEWKAYLNQARVVIHEMDHIQVSKSFMLRLCGHTPMLVRTGDHEFRIFNSQEIVLCGKRHPREWESAHDIPWETMASDIL
jgi:hypothetical protein